MQGSSHRGGRRECNEEVVEKEAEGDVGEDGEAAAAEHLHPHGALEDLGRVRFPKFRSGIRGFRLGVED